MGWETLSNERAPTTGKSMVTFKTNVSSKGKVTHEIILADTFSSKFDREDGSNALSSVRVQLGTEDNAGQVAIWCRPGDGEFGFKNIGRGGMRLSMPPFPGAPTVKMAQEACRTISVEAPTSFFIALPVESWARAASRGAVTGRKAADAGHEWRDPPRSVEPVQTPSKREDTSKPINPLAYLNKKGVDIAARADGSYVVKGKNTTQQAVLDLINSHRVANDVPALRAESVNWSARTITD